ncbi:MAG: DNA internalization-related competence protein ComEC/Rec2 [Cycloclasticus sp.]
MNNFQQKALLFCVGVVSIQLLPTLPPIYYLIFLGILALAFYKWAKGLSLCVLGFVWAASYAVSIQHNQLPRMLESQEILIRGKVVDLPVQESHSIRFLFDVETVVAPAVQHSFPSRIRLSWYGRGKEFKSGEKWQLLVKLKRPHGLLNPHGFDYEKWLFQQNIGATGYIRKSSDNQRLSQASLWDVGRWRESLKGYLESALVGSEYIGVIKALVLGDRSDISAVQWEVFRKTGTSHLIAISGLHIGLVSALVFAVFRYLGLRLTILNRGATQYAILASLLAAVLYAALAGFSIPTQRALVMLVVVLGGVYWQRHYKPFHIILVALLAILMFDPLAPMSVGFWLSFGAVAVILYGAVGRIKKQKRLRQLVDVQCWVSVGLMPMVLYFFQQVSLVAPLANILAVPFVSLAVVPLLMIALLLTVLDESLGVQVLELVNVLVALLWQFLEATAEVEFSALALSNVSLLACLIAMAGVALLLLPKGLLPKPVACLLFLPLLFPVRNEGLGHAEFKLVLLDVGQGLSAVIHTAEHTLVFDTGAKYSDKSDLATTVIIPYLQGEGIQQVDTLVISHGDNDHAGGAKTLLSKMPVKSLLTSVPPLFSEYQPIRCEEGSSWTLEGVSFEFLSPSRYSLFEGNNASCVLKVSSVNGSVLLTGDIEKNTEQSLSQYKPDQLKSDVLIAPHHGSSTSSTKEFIRDVNPDYVLFPVGYKNRFGFPKEKVVDRYKKQGINSFDTARHGAITVRFSGDSFADLKSLREESSQFWNWRP